MASLEPEQVPVQVWEPGQQVAVMAVAVMAVAVMVEGEDSALSLQPPTRIVSISGYYP